MLTLLATALPTIGFTRPTLAPLPAPAYSIGFTPPALAPLPAPAHTAVTRIARSRCTLTASEAVGGPIEALVDAVTASKCSVVNSRLMEAVNKEEVLKLVMLHSQRMNAVNVATALHRLASIEKYKRAERDALLRDRRFEALIELVVSRADQLGPRATADIFWSCATLRYWPPTVLRPMLTRVAAHLGRREKSNFEPHHLSIMMWAFAILECKPALLIERLEENAHQCVRDLNTQNCANLLWGFAKLRSPTTLLPKVSDHLLESGLIEKCIPIEVADLAFAAAQLGDAETAEPLMKGLARRAQPDTDLDKFTSRHLVTLLWAYARLNLRPDDASLAVWRETLIAATMQRPLMAADQRNLEVALERLGEDVAAWRPPSEDADDEEERDP